MFVPFVGAGESEQSLRAECLAARIGGIEVVPEAALTPASLAAAVDAAAAGPRPDPAAMALDMSGAEATARILADAIDDGAGSGK